MDRAEHHLMCHWDSVHVDHASDASTEAILVVKLWCLEGARWALAALDKESTDLASLLQLRPDQQDVGNGRVGDPCLGTA